MKPTMRYLLQTASAAAIGVAAYSWGAHTEQTQWQAYLRDAMTLQQLVCVSVDVGALGELRQGKNAEAIHGLELMVTSRLETLDVDRATNGELSKPVFTRVKGELKEYKTKFPATTLSPEKNQRLGELFR